MTAYVLLFALASIGISETIYLIRKRIVLEKPVCLIGKNCSLVLKSKYSKIFGVHNDVLGLLFYITILLISGFLIIGVGPLTWWNFILKISIAAGALLSLFLTFIQLRIIKAWCFWCLMSAFTVWLMGILLTFWRL